MAGQVPHCPDVSCGGRCAPGLPSVGIMQEPSAMVEWRVQTHGGASVRDCGAEMLTLHKVPIQGLLEARIGPPLLPAPAVLSFLSLPSRVAGIRVCVNSLSTGRQGAAFVA